MRCAAIISRHYTFVSSRHCHNTFYIVLFIFDKDIFPHLLCIDVIGMKQFYGYWFYIEIRHIENFHYKPLPRCERHLSRVGRKSEIHPITPYYKCWLSLIQDRYPKEILYIRRHACHPLAS